MARPALLRCGAAALVLALAGCLKVPPETDEPGTEQGAPKTAKELIDRYVTALGGEAALRKITQRTVEARMTFLPETGCTEADKDCRRDEKIGSFTLQTTTDAKMYRRTNLDNQIDEQGFDGKQGWSLRGGLLVLEDAEGSAISREDANLHWYLDLDKRGVELTLEPTRSTDHENQPRTLDGLRWHVKATPAQDKTLWFDRSTGLLSEEMLEDKDSEEVLRQWVLYDDYRAVDGVQIPHKIRLINQIGDRSQEVIFTTQRADHAKVDVSVFNVPKVPPPKRADDPLLAELAKVREAAAAAPKDRDAQLAHTRIAWASGHFEEAAAAAQATLKLDPKEIEALWILGRQQVLAGRFKEAEATLTRAGKAGVKPQLIFAQQAWIRSHQRDFTGIAKALDELGPENAALAGRYRTFVGQPLRVSVAGNGCQSDLVLTRDVGAPMLEVEIDGEKVVAMLDTGAADVIVDTKLAGKLKLPIRSRTPIGEKAEIGHSQIDNLKIGDINIANVPVDVFPSETLAQMSGSRQAASAVIGVRVLEQFQVTYDLPAKKLSLVHTGPKCKAALAANRRGASTPIWLHETHFVYTLGSMNGAEGLFLINTGMQGVDLTATSRSYALAGIGAPPLRRNEAAIVEVEDFSIGEVLHAKGLRGAYGYFEQGESSDQFRIDGMIGLDVLARRRVTFDFPERKLYFSDPSPAAAPAK
ncbi:retropepsin-like aspartic protease [Nannocystis sp.]|uniref:retropepsin-like aspartic protease n=1 Tax=Nannocystis sp. TaxID=1962667 RepID=UPI00242A04D4|nr:retropepsin-like aspartic protease [Nannocystis sp.]MBK7824490.1 retropepsin-like domain-containing protein [Nannocystis sp.]MBK9753260.1 retropepsin-like domain-containing protein [Nannocystis sp.]